jgi:PPOX class probable F420-dependent enzyme
MLEQFTRQRNVLLTTYKRDGTAVGTPVHIAVADGGAYIRTFGKAFKWRRVRHTPECELAPCTLRGRPTGPAVPVRGRILEGEEAGRAATALGRKYPIRHGLLIPRVHRLMRTPTIHMRFVPAGASGR